MMFLARNWWVFLLRGVFALVFGIAAISFPASAFLSLVLIFGAFALVDGIFALISAFRSEARTENWWWIILEGLLGIVVGLITLIQPASMAQAMILIIAIWAFVSGVFKIVTAIQLRKLIVGEFWMILGGIFSILFGVLIAADPIGGAFAVGFIIGIYAVLFGVTMVALSLRLRTHNARHSAA